MNAMWRLNTREGIAYVEDRGVALELIRSVKATSKARALDEAMAVYVTPRGRAFAWQIRFPYDRWSSVARTLEGVEEGGLRIERELPDEDAAGAAEPAAKKPRARKQPEAKSRAAGAETMLRAHTTPKRARSKDSTEAAQAARARKPRR